MGTKPSDPLRLPRASRNSIRAEPDGPVRVALTAPPVDGQANKALRAFVAKSLGLPKADVTLVAGERGRDKVLRIDHVDENWVICRLRSFLSSERGEEKRV